MGVLLFSLTPQIIADGPPYGIEYTRAELCVFVFRQPFRLRD